MTITLLDGNTEDTANIFFDPATYFFSDTRTGADLTFNMKLTDKQTFDGFDTQKWFAIASNLKNPGSGGGTTETPSEVPSTFSNFWGQIFSDPLAAPIDSLNKGVSKIFASSGVTKLATAAVIIVVAVFVFRSSKK